MSIAETDAIFARAYANAIKSKFQIDVGEHYVILTSPVTQRGMAAGDLIYPQMTNYLIYKFADALQYSDNPSYTGGSAGSYIQQLQSYIDWVATRSDPSPAAVTRMNNARNGSQNADNNYYSTLGQAITRYNAVKGLYPNQNFWQWAATSYPSLNNADRMRRSAETEFQQAMQQYYGPDANTLGRYRDNLSNAQSSTPLAGYNQDGLVDDQDLISSVIGNANNGQKPPQGPVLQSTIRVPLYSIGTYTSGIQSWISAAAKGATRDQVLNIDISQGFNTKWSDYGFKQANSGGVGGFWPFFVIEVSNNDKIERRNLTTSGRENDVTIQLSMIGIQKFDVRPGEWDVANIKTLFPNRVIGAPDVLSPKFAKITSVLVGYDVELKVTFKASMIDEVHNMYEEVKSKSGGLRIFGCCFGAALSDSSNEHVLTNFDDVKWDRNSGTMVLAPTKGQVYPTILAAVAQRLD